MGSKRPSSEPARDLDRRPSNPTILVDVSMSMHSYRSATSTWAVPRTLGCTMSATLSFASRDRGQRPPSAPLFALMMLYGIRDKQRNSSRGAQWPLYSLRARPKQKGIADKVAQALTTKDWRWWGRAPGYGVPRCVEANALNPVKLFDGTDA
jgi:hypothetical protein